MSQELKLQTISINGKDCYVIPKPELEDFIKKLKSVDDASIKERLEKYEKFERNQGNNKKKGCSIPIYKAILEYVEHFEERQGYSPKPRYIINIEYVWVNGKRTKITKGLYYSALKWRKEQEKQ